MVTMANTSNTILNMAELETKLNDIFNDVVKAMLKSIDFEQWKEYTDNDFYYDKDNILIEGRIRAYYEYDIIFGGYDLPDERLIHGQSGEVLELSIAQYDEEPDDYIPTAKCVVERFKDKLERKLNDYMEKYKEVY